ncbi:MAG TPA: hypothetical protein VEL06_00650 [Haliangiales bacterium]|nr:hypothetical protein [Haliangiales bacterium]
MALGGWIYQSREKARKFSFSSGGNVAENRGEVKAGKFLLRVGSGNRLCAKRVRFEPTVSTPAPPALNPFAVETGPNHSGRRRLPDPNRVLYKTARLTDGLIEFNFHGLRQENATPASGL